MLDEFLNHAVNAAFCYPVSPDSERTDRVFNTVYNAFILVYDEAKNGPKEINHRRILEYLNTIVSGGREICTDSRINWHYPLYAAIIAIAKNTPSIWNDLPQKTKDKLTLLMECLLVTTNFISCDKNNYRTGIGLTGDVQKNWNPNVQMSLVMPIVFLNHFFGGADAVDAILTEFDYDEFIARIESAGFSNILKIWTVPTVYTEGGDRIPGAKFLLTSGTKAYTYDRERDGTITNIYPAAGGEGAIKPYKFHEMRSDDVGILNFLLERNYSGGPIASRVFVEHGNDYAYTIDGAVSPYEGTNAMMLEFLSNGNRSCVRHSAVDFCMTTGAILSAMLLGIYDDSFFQTDLYQKVKAGNGDLIFKLEHGWHGWSGIGWNDFDLNNIHLPGYEMFKCLWDEELRK